MTELKQISLFAGVGAFELSAQNHGIKTVLSVEIDKYCCHVLRRHFPDTEVWNNDIRKLTAEYVRSRHGGIDIITAGFPCQSFSIAGKREGFKDITRGTLFFEVVRLAESIRPRYILLENVGGLLNHDGGKTILVIIKALDEVGYDVEWQVINSKYFVPQNRVRWYAVGHLRGERTRQIFPVREGSNKSLEEITKNQSQGYRVYDPNGISTTLVSAKTGLYKVRPCLTPDRAEKRQNGRRFKENGEPMFTLTSQDIHGIEMGSRIRRLTPVECCRLQAFPDDWNEWGIDENGKRVEISDTQRYKQMGNSITVAILDAIYKRIT